MNTYDFKAVTIDGCEIALEGYRGKVLLIVNTASRCGFTHQYEELETMYRKYKDDGLIILGFPCNPIQQPGAGYGGRNPGILYDNIRRDFSYVRQN